MTDEQLVDAAAGAALMADAGIEVPVAITSLLAAIAATKDEHQRHELARRSEARASNLTAIGLDVLRVAIFALAV